MRVVGMISGTSHDGIDVAVLSPNSPALDILWFADDPELAAAYARAQNNYMNAYASQQPGRLMWAGVIPLRIAAGAPEPDPQLDAHARYPHAGAPSVGSAR